MIDRGALVLSRAPNERYRGAHRTPLDGMQFTGRKGRDLGRRYASAVVAGDGVLEDLDEAIAFMHEARELGLGALEVIVFEVPQTPFVRHSLPVIEAPPAEDLALLGWDVIEPIEPYFSPLSSGDAGQKPNDYGLLATRAEAEALAASLNRESPGDEDYVAARVWRFDK